MRVELAAKRYAQAAFEIALERDDVDAWLRDLQTLADLAAQPGVLGVLESNRIGGEEKERLLAAGLSGVGPLALNLARLLVDKGRFALADQVREEFAGLVDEHRGLAHGSIVTAVELSDAEKEQVAGRLGEILGKKVLLESEVDPAIIGGMVARVGDRLIDGSARTKLLALKKELEAGRR
jgi:F-type H+-transporting ATPase subunit delta